MDKSWVQIPPYAAVCVDKRAKVGWVNNLNSQVGIKQIWIPDVMQVYGINNAPEILTVWVVSGISLRTKPQMVQISKPWGDMGKSGN